MNGKPEKTFCLKLTDFSFAFVDNPRLNFLRKLIQPSKEGECNVAKNIN